MQTIHRLVGAALLTTVTWPAMAVAQTRSPDLARASIEDLMNIEVVSVSHKEQRAGDVAAAVYVITQEDIRRSGMTTVPELLRLVPGVQVARINSNKWAIAVRGFNNLFADKVLVLIDGRTMVDRLNSGVFWESLDVPLDLIDRIEVIRGPGGATWGANAVNGVINIITKSADATRGPAATVRTGTFDGVHAAARYGGTLGRLSYRVNSQWSGQGQSRIDASTPANDAWESQTHGLRLDWTRAADTLIAHAGATRASLRGLFHAPEGPVPGVKEPWRERTDTREYHALARWTRRRGQRSSLDVQSFVNFRHNIDSVNPRQLMADVEAQYHTSLGARHDLVVGGGYRFLDERTDGGFGFSIDPRHADEHVVNAFAQDEIALGERLQLTLGAKIERDTYAGWALQPTARATWSLVPNRHRVWGAVSRAVRTPSLGDVSARYNFTSFVGQGGLPVVVGAIGNPTYKPEEVVNTEMGYRLELANASVDVTAFAAQYDNLKTSEPLAPRMELTPAPAHLFVPVQFGNLLEARTTGVEIVVRLTPVRWWGLEAGYSTFRLTPHVSPESRDAAAASFDGNVPGAQWQARSTFFLPRGMEIDTMLFHSGRLSSLGVDAYTRADARFEIPLTRRLSVAAVGQNLFDPAHAEYAGRGAIVTATTMPRSASVSLVWKP
jgi:iron complex outermembrane receptor protein